MSDIIYSKPGTKLVLAYPENGLDFDKENAKKIIEQYGKNPVFTLKDSEVGSSYSNFTFVEIPGRWNTVQFAEYPLRKYKVSRKSVLVTYEADIVLDAVDEYHATRLAEKLPETVWTLVNSRVDHMNVYKWKSDEELANEKIQCMKDEIIHEFMREASRNLKPDEVKYLKEKLNEIIEGLNP